MGFTYGCIRVLTCAIAIGAPALSEAPSTPGNDVYRRFFREISRMVDTGTSIQVQLNGVLTKYRQAVLHEALGLTVAEAKQVRAAAENCERAIQNLQEGTQPWLFAARLDAIASEQAAAVLAVRTKDLERRIELNVSQQVEGLKHALGEAAFRKVETFLSAHANGRVFFPLVRAEESSTTSSTPVPETGTAP